MNSIEMKTVDQLIDFGFAPETAKEMVRTKILPSPLTQNERLNARLLGRHTELDKINTDEYGHAAIFLKRAYRTNMFLSSVPLRYDFTPEQRRKYMERPFEWEIECDLKKKIDWELGLIIPDEEKRMDMYREMYLNGVWAGCDTINQICAELREISSGHDDLEAVVSEWWPVMFSFYTGTLQYIGKLRTLFRQEHIWEVFSKTVVCGHEFSDHFNPYDRKDAIIRELKGEFSRYLSEEGE